MNRSRPTRADAASIGLPVRTRPFAGLGHAGLGRTSLKLLPALRIGAIIAALAKAGAGAPLPEDVPPVLGTAVVVPSPTPSGKDTIRLVVPKVAWEVVLEKNPKREWPEFRVEVEEAVLKIELEEADSPVQLTPGSLDRILDLHGQMLDRDQVRQRLAGETAVLVSVSGRMPDPFYLQCSKPDTLIIALGLLHTPASGLLPRAIVAPSQAPSYGEVRLSCPIISAVVCKQLGIPARDLGKADLERVTELGLADSAVTDASLEDLAKFPNLSRLVLAFCRGVTDEGITGIAECSNLTTLSLVGTKVTDNCIDELAKLPKLATVGLSNTRVTAAGVAKLKRALPRCTIHSDAHD